MMLCVTFPKLCVRLSFELIQVIDESMKVNSANVSDKILSDIHIAFLWKLSIYNYNRSENDYLPQRKLLTVTLLSLELSGITFSPMGLPWA